jgi:hypothetical protein
MLGSPESERDKGLRLQKEANSKRLGEVLDLRKREKRQTDFKEESGQPLFNIKLGSQQNELGVTFARVRSGIDGGGSVNVLRRKVSYQANELHAQAL